MTDEQEIDYSSSDYQVGRRHGIADAFHGEAARTDFKDHESYSYRAGYLEGFTGSRHVMLPLDEVPD